jgi:hypothetical protein
MQPYQSWSKVPKAVRSQFRSDGVDQIPTRLGELDALVGPATQRGMTVVPTVVNAPRWDGRKHKGRFYAAPTSDQPYGEFLKALIFRYGPHGTFWKNQSPAVPIRMWQIWNEPNEFGYWPYRHFAKSYVAMLRVAHDAIKRADPGAKVLLAGLSNYSWDYLNEIYQVPGAQKLFDVAGVHPYTRNPQGVITIIGNMRRVMKAHGDSGKPIDADEMGWPSSVGQTSQLYGFETTEAGQATNISQVLPLLEANRKRLGILGFYYFTWAGVESPGAYTFDFSGLLRYSHGQFIAKPGLSSFSHGALALEGCAAKDVATRCSRPA